MDKKKTQVGAEHETEKKKYPIGPEHYSLFEEVGQGVSACVRRALCKPFDEIVAIKILDFERDNCDLVRSIYIYAITIHCAIQYWCDCSGNRICARKLLFRN